MVPPPPWSADRALTAEWTGPAPAVCRADHPAHAASARTIALPWRRREQNYSTETQPRRVRCSGDIVLMGPKLQESALAPHKSLCCPPSLPKTCLCCLLYCFIRLSGTMSKKHSSQLMRRCFAPDYSYKIISICRPRAG